MLLSNILEGEKNASTSENQATSFAHHHYAHFMHSKQTLIPRCTSYIPRMRNSCDGWLRCQTSSGLQHKICDTKISLWWRVPHGIPVLPVTTETILEFQKILIPLNTLPTIIWTLKQYRTPCIAVSTNKNRDVIKHTFDHVPINSSNLFDLQRIII